MRSQPGSQPVCQPARGRCSRRRRRTRADAPRRGAPAGARAALAPRRRAGRSVAAAGLTTAWGWGCSGPDPTAAGMGCAPGSGWRSGWAKLCGARWTAVRSPGAQGPRARGELLWPPSPGLSSLRGLWRGAGRRRLRREGGGGRAARAGGTVPPTTEGGIRDPRKSEAQGGAWKARRR